MSKKLRSLLAVSEFTGRSREFCRAQFRRAGIPTGGNRKYSDEEIVQAFGNAEPGVRQTLKDEKLQEEIRKLKIRNDKDSDKLVPVASECSWLSSVVTDAMQTLEQKLCNEMPAMVEHLDAAQIRFRAKKIFDEVREKLRPLGERHKDLLQGPKPKENK